METGRDEMGRDEMGRDKKGIRGIFQNWESYEERTTSIHHPTSTFYRRWPRQRPSLPSGTTGGPRPNLCGRRTVFGPPSRRQRRPAEASTREYRLEKEKELRKSNDQMIIHMIIHVLSRIHFVLLITRMERGALKRNASKQYHILNFKILGRLIKYFHNFFKFSYVKNFKVIFGMLVRDWRTQFSSVLNWHWHLSFYQSREHAKKRQGACR